MTANDDIPAVVPGMAEAVERRRLALGLGPSEFARLSGLTRQGLDDVRAGRRKAYLAKTIVGVARSLRWGLDWYDRLQAGEEPVEDDTGHSGSSITDRLGRMESEMAGLREDVQRLVRAFESLRQPAGPQGRA